MPEPFTELLPDTDAVKPVRRVITFIPFQTPGSGMLEIIRGKKGTRYVLTEVLDSHGWLGRVFRLQKPDPDESTDPDEPHYHLCIAPDRSHDLCECKGFGAHGHCSHLDAVHALIENGRLDSMPLSNPDADVERVVTAEDLEDMATRCGF